jgi:hypothetical protein
VGRGVVQCCLFEASGNERQGLLFFHQAQEGALVSGLRRPRHLSS